MYRTILVPIDGSEHAKQALEVACQLASASDATIHLLHVAAPGPGDAELGFVMGSAATDELTRRAEARGQDLLEDTIESLGAVEPRLTATVAWGSPARTIVEEARSRDVEAIVMGSRGLSDLKGLAVGSVSHKVMHIATCTVVTVHSGP